MKIRLHIGLDVHKNLSTVVATADSLGSEPAHYGTTAHSEPEILQTPSLI